MAGYFTVKYADVATNNRQALYNGSSFFSIQSSLENSWQRSVCRREHIFSMQYFKHYMHFWLSDAWEKKNSFNLRRTFRKYITNLYRNYDISRNPFVQFFIGLHWLILAEWMFSALYRLNGCLSLLNRLMSIEKYGLRYYATPEWTKVSLNSTLYRTRLFYLFNFFLVNDGGHKIQKKKNFIW